MNEQDFHKATKIDQEIGDLSVLLYTVSNQSLYLNIVVDGNNITSQLTPKTRIGISALIKKEINEKLEKLKKEFEEL
jgi:hypothetical protein